MSGLRQLRELAGKINQEYDAMAIEFRAYQAKTGLDCIASCGKCCLNPEIEASPLEMLPMALDLYDRGLALQTLDRINDGGDQCISYYAINPDGSKGFCASYAQRPSICRMFGAAGFAAKDGSVNLSVCKAIKQERVASYEAAKVANQKPPVMANWSARIRTLEPRLGEKVLPINQALRYILEKIVLIASYDDDPLPRAS